MSTTQHNAPPYYDNFVNTNTPARPYYNFSRRKIEHATATPTLPMDFSHGAYYADGSQSYEFPGIPPLTPSTSDDYGHNRSPNGPYTAGGLGAAGGDAFQSSGQFHSFDHYAAAPFNPQAPSQAFPGPAGPPTPPINTLHAQSQAQVMGGMTGMDGASGVGGLDGAKAHQAEAMSMSLAKPDSDTRNIGSNSDDDDTVPAQNRRKAQNRAAQRAFRERKERHVKELEAKLASLLAAQENATTENERLKADLLRIKTENEILRATSGSQNGSLSPVGAAITTGPQSYNPTDFYSELLANHTNKTPSHRVVESESGERLMAAGAAWDLIVNHELFQRGYVDLAGVSERLKPQARCDGQGPVFEEGAILRAIQDSVANGSDELL